MRRRSVLSAVGFLASPVTAIAQGLGRNEEGPHGGALEKVAGVFAEFVINERTVTVYLYEGIGKPISSDGFTGSVSVDSGSKRQVVPLSKGPGNVLSGRASRPIAPNTPSTLLLNTPFGQNGQTKF